MSPFVKRLLKDAGIYYLKAVAFALVSYLLVFAVYGGVRVPLLAWSVLVVVAFTIAYIPFFIRSIRAAKKDEQRS